MAKAKTLTVGIVGEDKGISKPFDKTGDEADRLAKKLRTAGDKAGKGLGDGVEDGTKGLPRKLRTVGDKAGEQLKSGLSAGAEGLGSIATSAGDMFSGGFDVGGIADAASGVFESLPGKVGPIAGVAGTALAGALAVGFEESLDREMSADRLSARLGLTGAEMERVGQISGDLFADAYGESIEEVNTALDAVLTSIGDLDSLTDAELTRAGQRALEFADIWGVDVAAAVGDVGILVSTGLAKDFDEGFDLMHVAMQRTPAAFREELIPAIEEYSGFVTGLGLTGEEMFALMTRSAQDFGSFGIDKAGDALKEFTLLSTDMSDKSVAAYDTIGLDAQTMANRILAGGDTARGAFDKIVEGLLAIEDPATRANTAIALFGTPLEDMSVSEIPTFLENLVGLKDGLGNVEGAAQTAGDTLADNLGTRMETLRRGALDKLVTFVDERLIPGFGRLSDIWEQRVAPALGVVEPPLRALVGFLQQHPAITQFAAAIGLVALAMVVLFNPLTVAAVLIGSVILVIQKLWGALKAGFAWVREHWPQIKAFLTDPISSAAAFIAGRWEAIKAGATAAKNWITGRFDGLVSFVSGLPGRIGRAASGMWDGIASGFRSVLNRIIGWWNRLSFPRFDIPEVDPLGRFGPSIGGGSIGGWELPNIPTLHQGGTFQAPPGQREGLAMLLDGEAVSRPGEGSGGDTVVVNVYVRGSVLSDRDLNATVNRGIDKGRRLIRAGRA